MLESFWQSLQYGEYDFANHEGELKGYDNKYIRGENSSIAVD
jgi:hypothetical protein